MLWSFVGFLPSALLLRLDLAYSLPLQPIHFLLLHPLFPLHQDIPMIVQQVAMVVQTLPLHRAVCDEIYHSFVIEHVAGCCEGFPAFVAADFVDERRKEEDHVAALIHDGRAAVRTRDFAG